jgi:TPR repeat protein/transglutaminase-like putative cysteine protease
MFEHILEALVFWLLALIPGLPDKINLQQGAAWVDPGFRRTVARYVVRFDEKGLSTSDFDFEIEVRDENGIKAFARQSFVYCSDWTDLTTDGFATVKADGSVVAVEAGAMEDQQADPSSPYRDGWRTRIVTYPNVVPGDKLRGHLVYKAKRPAFGGEFANYWSVPSGAPPEVMELTIDGPASKPLHISARNVEHSEERRDGRIVHHVRFRHDTPTPGPIGLDPFDSARRFEASTFTNYAALAAELNARNAPMALPDDALKKLSAEIVGDATEPGVKVERIHDWVARNIRYPGVGFEHDISTSQPASVVLDARYGDSTAHATVFKALLAAQGIETNLVAVNFAPQYMLTEVATANFDHAIVYVPKLDRYLDPTVSTAVAGDLSDELGGKPALNIDTGILTNIPALAAERFTMTADTDYTLASDGTRRARSILSGTGLGAEVGRVVARGSERLDQAAYVANRLENAELSGSGNFTFPDPHDVSDSYAFTANFQISKAVKLNDGARVRMLPLTDPRVSPLTLSIGREKGDPFHCRSMQYRETSSLTIPPDVNFNEMPAPLTYAVDIKGTSPYGTANGRIEATGTATIEGRTVRSNVVFRLTVDAPVCPAEFTEAIRTGWYKLIEFNREPVGLTKKAAPYVTEISVDFDRGVQVFSGGYYWFAERQLKPFAERGGARAQAYLGYIYENGSIGVMHDYREAVRWYRMAAEQNDAFSQSRLGYLYQNGLGVDRDETQAAQWYAKAADRGDIYAQNCLALMYRDGRGLARDYEQAAKWFTAAADRGSAWAQMNLGVLYFQGNGVPVDYTRGLFWLRNAADRNESHAQYNLGYAYESGTGVSQSKQQAIEWYAKAVEGGDSQAKERLDRLTDRSVVWAWFRRIGSLVGV